MCDLPKIVVRISVAHCLTRHKLVHEALASSFYISVVLTLAALRTTAHLDAIGHKFRSIYIYLM